VSIPLSNLVEPVSVLEISLDRIRRNYLALQKMLAKGCDCAAVVKADCYGLGVAAIVPQLYKANCRHFYVAHASEGVAVRTALKGVEEAQAAQIYAFHGSGGVTAEELVEHKIIPVLNSLGDIDHWSDFARERARKMPAVIHIDTGMNRLGLTSMEVGRMKNNGDKMRWLDVRYVMSHLACADESGHHKNELQLMKFKYSVDQMGVAARLSFANSSGIFLGSGYHFDQVRPGCALYGINPQTGQKNHMSGVVTLKARILQIKEVPAEETVGYGASYKLSSSMKLATISAGYADGILRSTGENGMVYIAGQKCPLVGRVSMDTIIADVTQVKERFGVGDWAEIIGPNQPVDDLAAQAKTIGYEMLTSLGKRYTRIYKGADGI